jgi:non-specific serine/threonine protein kinase
LEQAVELLSRQPSLLLLDNFEQLVEEGAPIVRALLERVPSLRCLITSRQRLELSGEREFVVPPLSVPAGVDAPERLSMYESVQLFIDRAQAVKPDFQVTKQNAPAVAELCQRLEGIPLAIELAAARAQIVTPAQMLSQLSRRFEFLVSRRRDSAKRHQTLHAAIDWGYRLLSPELQHFFARLSVFRGGWTLAAAETVCEEPLALDYLAELRESSFVLAEEEGEETRFRMLETLREFAHECLAASGETESVRRRHAHFYLDLAQAEADRYEYQGTDPEFFLRLADSPETLLVERWVAVMEREDHNLRTAGDWAVASGEREVERRLTDVIFYSPLNRVPVVIMQQAIKRGASEIQVEPDAELVRTRFQIDGEWHEVLRLPRSVHQRLLARFKLMTEMKVEERNVLQEGKLAVDLWEKQYDLPARCQPTPHGEAMAIRITARVPSEESLAVWRETGEKQTTIVSLVTQAGIARTDGDLVTARSLLQDALKIGRELDSKPHVALGLVALGCVEAAEGRMEGAARLFGAQWVLRRGLSLPPAVQADYEHYAAAARATLGDAAFRAAAWEGEAMSLEQSIAYALEESTES